ncbi:deoxynucleoside kinase [Williamsoniiplasma lucivorax]|uniref:Deoxyguanosine kinase n=1 Tax=Williamsoniiplasma lucivorax TaxID=209274 RepID=A0A2S5RDA5_9MOLU|nr:deoxynucleoside kinase [Williamsoniiplasma lucivorax]PPE05278.1 deoxyguanosine kinase [Williamsoniiplasma lucivorax]
MRIAIFGTVGAGKTTISHALAAKYGYLLFPEPIEQNPYFAAHYHDMAKDAFKMQIYMLTARSQQLNEAQDLQNVIFDRTILENLIFVETNHKLGYINDIDFKTYVDFYQTVIMAKISATNPFDLVVYLKVSTKKALARIKNRNRAFELNLSDQYWEILNSNYDKHFTILKNKFNFVVIDADVDDVNVQLAQIACAMQNIKSKNN